MFDWFKKKPKELTAAQAQKLNAKMAKVRKAQQERKSELRYLSIMAEIKQETENGSFYAKFSRPIPEDIEKRLIELGYKVQYNPKSLLATVSWEHVSIEGFEV